MDRYADQSDTDYWAGLLEEIHGDIDAIRENNGSSQAIAALYRRAAEARRQLEASRGGPSTAGEDDLLNMPKEQAFAHLEQQARATADDYLEPVVQVYLERHALPPLDEMFAAWRKVHKPPLRVVDGGEG